MIELMFVLGFIVAHVCMVGFFKPTMAAISYRRCKRTNHQYDDVNNNTRTCNHDSDGFWLAFFWMFTLPFNVFNFLGLCLARDPGRIEAARKAELAELEHKRELAIAENAYIAEVEKGIKNGDTNRR